MGEPNLDLHEVALKRVQARRGFYTHLVVYLVVNLFLWGVWFVGAAQSGVWYPWPMWVSMGWGIGVVLNGWAVYQRPLTEDDIQAELRRMAH